MNIKHQTFALIVATLLAGCATSSGVAVSEAQLSEFRPTETTEAQAVAKLGAPTMRTRMGDGSVLLVYSSVNTTIRGSTFIPIVGAFTGGADSASNTVSLRFGPDGKLIDTSTSSSAFRSQGLTVTSTTPAGQ